VIKDEGIVALATDLGVPDFTSDTTLLLLAWRCAARRCWQVRRQAT
jgi:hypothetical protein